MGIDEINHMHLSSKLELVTARMEANAEIRKYEEIVNHLNIMLRTVCQERDEARDQLQLLLRSHFTPQVNMIHPQHPSIENIKKLDASSKPCSYELSLARLESSHEKLSSIGFSRDKLVDSSSLVIDKMVCGKPLPQKGNLLRTVTEAGPLLQTLLIDPLPRWQNPPPLSSSGNESSTTVDDQASANQNSVVVTSLSLTVPGNYCEVSLPLASGLGLSVNNIKPITCLNNDSDMMLDDIFTTKKRKLV